MSKLVRIAVEPGPVPANAASRVGGEPIGMTRETWPLWEGKPMHHVITLERAAIVPSLPEAIAAVAVFVNDIGNNEAYEPGTPKTKVVMLSAQDLARGETTAAAIFGEAPGYAPAAPGKLVFETADYDFDTIRDPDTVEDGPEDEIDDDQVSYAVSSYFGEQRSGTLGKAEVHGLSAEHVAWCQGAEAPEGQRVLFWFYEALVPGLNCGDGFMYVTASADAKSAAAWWQC